MSKHVGAWSHIKLLDCKEIAVCMVMAWQLKSGGRLNLELTKQVATCNDGVVR